MKYLKKINLLDEVFTKKEQNKLKKDYDKSYNNYTIKEKN